MCIYASLKSVSSIISSAVHVHQHCSRKWEPFLQHSAATLESRCLSFIEWEVAYLWLDNQESEKWQMNHVRRCGGSMWGVREIFLKKSAFALCWDCLMADEVNCRDTSGWELSELFDFFIQHWLSKHCHKQPGNLFLELHFLGLG